MITFPKMTMEPVVVEGAAEQGMPSALPLSISSVPRSFSPVLLLSQLVAAAVIDIITVLATERQKVLTDEFGEMRFRKCFVGLL